MADDKNKYQDDAIIGGTGLGAAGLMAKSQLDKGNLTGRESVFHGTENKNVESIMRDGIKANKANDPNAYTRTILRHIDPKELDDLSYVAKRKSTAEGINASREYYKQKNPFQGELFKQFMAAEEASRNSSVLNAKVPIWKMQTVENPELLGAKTPEEFIKKREEMSGMKATLYDKVRMTNNFKTVGEGSHVIKGDIGPEFIKGSGKYQRAGAEEVKDFVMKNKKRFGKGAGSVLGAGLAAGIGAKYLLDKNEKKASVKDGMKRAIKSVKDLQSGATKQKASAEAKEAERLYNVFRNKVGDKPEYLKDIREYKANMISAKKKEKLINAGTTAIKTAPLVGVAGSGVAGKTVYDNLEKHNKTATLIDIFYQMMK